MTISSRAHIVAAQGDNPVVVTLDLATGALSATSQREAERTPQLLMTPASVPVEIDHLTPLLEVAQRILDGADTTGRLTLAADEAYDELQREVAQWSPPSILAYRDPVG